MSSGRKISVIGLGPMGQAVARNLLTAGYQVTVWNRTPERGDSLVKIGAHRASTAQSAISASELIFVSLADYDVMWQVFENSESTLAGRTVVNLSSDTPRKTQQAAERMLSLGAEFLAGGPMSIASEIGTSTSSIHYGGNAAVFENYHDVFAVLGEAGYLGEDPAHVQLVVQAKYGLLFTAITGLVQAIALAGSGGISARAFLPELIRFFENIPQMAAPDGIDELATKIDAGDYVDLDGDNAMLAAGLEHLVATSEDAGVDAYLPRAVLSFYHRAVDEGFAREGWTRLVEMMGRPGLDEDS